MKYYAVSDLMGNLEAGCFSKSAKHSICQFFWKENGLIRVSDVALDHFWQSKHSNGYCIVELDVPSPMPINVFPHKEIKFSCVNELADE